MIRNSLRATYCSSASAVLTCTGYQAYRAVLRGVLCAVLQQDGPQVDHYQLTLAVSGTSL